MNVQAFVVIDYIVHVSFDNGATAKNLVTINPKEKI